MSEGKYICLYGEEDIEWIRRFTRAAKDVALEAGIQLEFLYLGKSRQQEEVSRKFIRTIEKENISHSLDWNLSRFFWVRLVSMWQSKGKFMSELSQVHVRDDNRKNDVIMQGIVSMLSFGSSDSGWALIEKASGDMSNANGDHMLRSFNEYKDWKLRHNERGFTPALNEYLAGLHKIASRHGTSLMLPATGFLPETVDCAECGRLMEKFVHFRCYSD